LIALFSGGGWGDDNKLQGNWPGESPLTPPWPGGKPGAKPGSGWGEDGGNDVNAGGAWPPHQQSMQRPNMPKLTSEMIYASKQFRALCDMNYKVSLSHRYRTH